MVRIADLRRRLVMEAASDAPDGAGGGVRTWQPVDSVFAEVEPRRRRESVDDGRRVGLVTHRIVLRFRTDVAGDVRFVDGTTRYRVLAVEPHDARRRFLECLCEEEQA